jgi:ATP-binding cassette subfamily C protein
MLIALMVASGLTESLGVMLLVPLLATLGPGDQGIGGDLFARMGLHLSLGTALVLFVALVLVRGLINFARNRAAMQLELTAVDTLRRRAWQALLGADWRAMAGLRKADGASLLIGNIDRAGYAVNQAAALLATLMTLAGLVLAGLAVAPLVTLGAGLGGALVLLAYRGLRSRAAVLGERLGTAYQTLHRSIGESLGALRTVKSLGGEAQAEAAALAGFANLRETSLSYQKVVGIGQLALQFGGAAVLAMLVWFAVARWGLGMAAILPMVALFARALPLLGTLQECWQNFEHARPSVAAVFELVDRAEAAREADPGLAPPPEPRSSIAVEGLSVRYSPSDHPALDAVSLELPVGGITALTGPSGAGKSTLADVLGGLISPDAGELLIDGKPLNPAQRKAWRSRVAYVQQDPALLADTVRANLLWAHPAASDGRLSEVLRQAACQFVLGWPEGLDTRIGDGGRTLSGGERQRLMLARALLREPALLILDEATSALDTANETQVAEAILRLKGAVTVLIIAHRGTLTELADHTFQLDRGRLVN